MRLVSFLDNFRCRRTRIIYGDQALFVRRELFESLGGFPEQPILEDVAFCEKLVRVASKASVHVHGSGTPQRSACAYGTPPNRRRAPIPAPCLNGVE